MRRRIADWAWKFLKQGLSPERLAVCVALAFMIGVFPVIGSTSLLCGLAAVVGRLNFVAMQSVNLFMYPLQFIFLIPFYKLGGYMFGCPPAPYTAVKVVAMIRHDMLGAVHLLWTTTMHAIVAWSLVAPGVIAVIYVVTVTLLRRSVSNHPAWLTD